MSDYSSIIHGLPEPAELQPCWYSPRKFLAKTDRRGIQYADPFPGLEHRYIEANGIRQAHGIIHAISISTSSKTAPTEWPVCISCVVLNQARNQPSNHWICILPDSYYSFVEQHRPSKVD